MEPCSDSSLPDSQYAIKATPMHTFNLLIESRVRMQCPRCFTLAVASPGCWKSIDTPGSLPPEGAPGSPRQFNSFSTACHSPAAASMMKLESLSASPQVLLGSSPLPQTPPSQLSRAASSPPPLRRSRNTTSPPPASHPILSSAITVACTAAPDAIHSSGRLPIQRQLGFSFQNTQPPQHTSPFAAAATTPEPASLLDKTNSLPGPQHVPRTVLSDHKDSLSLQDSGMLTHMLHRATLLHTEREGHASGSSCNGPACRYRKTPNHCLSANTYTVISDTSSRQQQLLMHCILYNCSAHMMRLVLHYCLVMRCCLVIVQLPCMQMRIMQGKHTLVCKNGCLAQNLI